MRREASAKGVVVPLAIITTVLVAQALVWTRSVILPFAFALFVAYAIEPILRLLARVRFPRWLAAIVILGASFVAFQLTLGVLAAAAKRLDARLPEWLAALQQLLDKLPLAEDTGIRVDNPENLRNLALAAFGGVGSIAGAITTVVSSVGLVTVLTIAIVIGRKKFDLRLAEVADSTTDEPGRGKRVLQAIEAKIQRYMLVKAGVSAAMGFVFFLVLAAFGFEFAVLAGFFMMLLNFIPTFGPVIAVVPVIVLHFLDNPERPGFAVAASLASIAVPVFFVNWVEPKLFGEQLGLNFFAVILALLVWGLMWGIAGAIIAVPITVAVSIVCKEVPGLRAVHDLLRE